MKQKPLTEEDVRRIIGEEIRKALGEWPRPTPYIPLPHPVYPQPYNPREPYPSYSPPIIVGEPWTIDTTA